MLLIRPAQAKNECCLSYLIRVSEANGFKHAGHLLNFAGLNWKNRRIPVHKILVGEFDIDTLLLALDLKCYKSKTSKIYTPFRQVLDTPYVFVRSPKVCPDCLKEQEYCLYIWSFIPVLACTKHSKILIDTHPITGKRLSWYRSHLSRFDGDSYNFSNPVHSVDPAVFQMSQYFESLILRAQVRVNSPIILRDLTFRESLSLIHFIAHYQTRLLGESFKPVLMSNLELVTCYLRVWEMLKEWPESFYDMLSQYIDTPMSKKGFGGLNKHYRDLYERLNRQKENKGIALLKTEFDRYIEAYWPGVLEPDRVTRIKFTPSNRKVISKNEVARILGSRLDRIDSLVQQKKLSITLFKGKAHYNKDEAEKYAKLLSDNWSMLEACEAMQVSRYQLKKLLDAGIIPYIQKPGKLNRDWIIDKKRYRIFLKELVEKATTTQSMMTLEELNHKGYSLVRIISSMKEGSLKYNHEKKLQSSDKLFQFTGLSFK